MNDQHLGLWSRVNKTDHSATKESTLGGRKVTSLNHMFTVEKATEMFGPIGIGWNFRIIEERYDQGAPVMSQDGSVQGHEIVHTVRIGIWFNWEGVKSEEITQFGHTKFVYRTNRGTWITDDEAPKKSVSDAIKKTLSLLGFSADVYTGMFDNEEYVEERRIKEGIKRADDADEAIVEQRNEFTDWIAQQVNSYALVPSAGALKTYHRATVSKARRRAATLQINPDQVEKKLNDRYQERLVELSPSVDLVCHECGGMQYGKEGQQCTDCGSEKTAPAGTGANDQTGSGENQ